MAHGWSAQWKYDSAMACCAAASVPARTVPGGGEDRCEIGSATAKNIRPMPIPALNIIATHEIVRNSGRSSSLPRRI